MHSELKDAEVTPSPAPVFLDRPLVPQCNVEQDDLVNSDNDLKKNARP